MEVERRLSDADMTFRSPLPPHFVRSPLPVKTELAHLQSAYNSTLAARRGHSLKMALPKLTLYTPSSPNGMKPPKLQTEIKPSAAAEGPAFLSTPPPLASGRAAFAEWTNYTGRFIKSFSASWDVPPVPAHVAHDASNGPELRIELYMRLGTDAPATEYVDLVLQLRAGTWTALTRSVNSNTSVCVASNPVAVRPGDRLRASITSADGATYMAAFEGLLGSCVALTATRDIRNCSFGLNLLNISSPFSLPPTPRTRIHGVTVDLGRHYPFMDWAAHTLIPTFGVHFIAGTIAQTGELSACYGTAAPLAESLALHPTIVPANPSTTTTYALDPWQEVLRQETTVRKDANTTTTTITTTDLGGPFITPPAVLEASTAAGATHLFALGLDHGLKCKALGGGTWHPSPDTWTALGGFFLSLPVAVSTGDRIHVFGVGPFRSCIHKSYSLAAAVWSPEWENLGGRFVSGLSAVSLGDKRIDIFGLDERDAVVARTCVDGVWSEWARASKDGCVCAPVVTGEEVRVMGARGEVLRKCFDQTKRKWMPEGLTWEEIECE